MPPKIGKNCVIEPTAILGENVTLGDDSYVGHYCLLGEGLGGAGIGEKPPLVIGHHARIRSHTCIYSGAIIGNHFQSGNHVTIREFSEIGDHVSLGSHGDLQGYLTIGDRTRMHSNVHVGQKTTIEGDVFIFPYAIFTNDPLPPCGKCLKGPTIKKYAVIATRAVILPHVTIHSNALVGANSVVGIDVPEYMLVAGNPAKIIKDVRELRCKIDPTCQPYPWPEKLLRKNSE